MHERHEGMEDIGDAMKVAQSREMKGDAPDLAAVRTNAATIAELAPKASGWFPPGTGPDVGKTHAKPAIWQKPEDFAAKAGDFRQGGRKLQHGRARQRRSGDQGRPRRARQELQGLPRPLPCRRRMTACQRRRRQPVWDLPTRLFHWTLAALIGFSWWSAEEEQLELHIYSGYAILTLMLFRLLWGVFGSSTARFSNFVRGPAACWAMFATCAGGAAIGHTPLGALSVVALLALLVAQVATGLVNSDEDGLVEGPLAPLVSCDVADAAHEVHELLFNVLLVFIGLHIAAVLYYRLVLGKKLVGR